MSEYNIQMNKYNALNAEYDQLYPQPMKHASTHAKDGSDPITPSSIGAAELGADGKVLTSQIPSIEVDAYTKVQTLSDTTKTLFGLDATAVPDDVLSLIKTLIDNANASISTKAKIQTGSYVGTGTYGASNPCSLTFDFVPEYIVVIPNVQYNVAVSSNYYGESAPAVFFNGGSKYTVWLSWSSSSGGNSGTRVIYYNVSDNVLSWYIDFGSGYTGPSGAQMNKSGQSYFYCAFGK